MPERNSLPLRSIRNAIRFAFGEGGSVKTRVLRSGMWVGASESMIAVLNIVRSVFLARLLSPEIFGLMGIASIALRTFETFTRPGSAQALIARQQDFSEAAPTAFTMLVVRGFALAALMAAAAPWIGRFYGESELAPCRPRSPQCSSSGAGQHQHDCESAQPGFPQADVPEPGDVAVEHGRDRGHGLLAAQRMGIGDRAVGLDQHPDTAVVSLR